MFTEFHRLSVRSEISAGELLGDRSTDGSFVCFYKYIYIYQFLLSSKSIKILISDVFSNFIFQRFFIFLTKNFKNYKLNVCVVMCNILFQHSSLSQCLSILSAYIFLIFRIFFPHFNYLIEQLFSLK